MEDGVKALSDGQGHELQHSKILKREKLNPFHLLTRVSRPEEGDKDKSAGEISKCPAISGVFNRKHRFNFFGSKILLL